MTYTNFTVKRRNFAGDLNMAKQILIAEIEEFCGVDLTQFCDECLEDLLYISITAVRDDSATLEIEINGGISLDKYHELLGEDDHDDDDDGDDNDPEPSPITPVTEPQPA